MTLDQCKPNLYYIFSADEKSITGVEISAKGNKCNVPVPVTVPGSASTDAVTRSDKVGSEPLIVWTTLSGSPVTINIDPPIPIKKR